MAAPTTKRKLRPGGLVFFALLSLGALYWTPYSFWRPAPETILAPAVKVQVAIVPSGDPEFVRTQEGVRLYFAGRVKYLFFSGAGYGGDSAENLAKYAQKAGVPRGQILVDSQAENTYQNMLAARRIAQKHAFHQAVVVTSGAHARRAFLVARALGVSEVLWVSPVVARGDSRLGFAREWLKALRYAYLGHLAWREALGG